MVEDDFHQLWSETMKYWLSGLILLVLCLGSAPTHSASEGRPVIVASTTQIADFARQVAGDRAG